MLPNRVDNLGCSTHNITSMLIVMALGLLAIVCLIQLINVLPVANLMKEFGLPSVAAYTILYYLNVGSTVTTIISILTGLATGGLSLIAAAGKLSIKAFLNKKKRELGTRAFVAW